MDGTMVLSGASLVTVHLKMWRLEVAPPFGLVGTAQHGMLGVNSQANGLLMYVNIYKFRSRRLAEYMARAGSNGHRRTSLQPVRRRPTDIGIVPKLGRFNAGLNASTACRAISGQRLTAGKMHRQPFFAIQIAVLSLHMIPSHVQCQFAIQSKCPNHSLRNFSQSFSLKQD